MGAFVRSYIHETGQWVRVVRVLVIAVSYESGEDLAHLLQSLPDSDRDPLITVHLVENGRRDLGSEVLESRAAVVGHHYPCNPGYLPAVGRVLSSLPDSLDWEWVVVCNADISFSPDFFEVLRSVASNVETGGPVALAPSILDLASGAESNPFMDKRPTAISLIAKLVVFRWLWLQRAVYSLISRARGVGTTSMVGQGLERSVRRTIYAPHGACFLANRALVELIDFSLQLPLYGEEVAVGETAWRVGGDVWFWPSLRCQHNAHTSTSMMNQSQRRRLQSKAAWRSFRLLYMRGFPKGMR